MGQMSSNGHRIYGYDYIRRSDDAPATLSINEEQADVVRSIFEMFASGNYGLVTIVRNLESNRIPTCGGVCRLSETMTDPGTLRGCMKAAEGADDRCTARELTLIARRISALDHERRRLIDRYAADMMAGEDYIRANRALDCELERLIREKARLVAALRSPSREDFVDASVRQFCATAWGRGRSRDPFFGEEQRQSGYAFSKAGRLIEAKAEPVPGAIEPKATSIE
jgi:hypothetical protein